jgi:hypothetical protein
MKAVFVLLSLMLCASQAFADAQGKPSREETAKLRSENAAVVAGDKDTAGVFTVQDDGTIKHVQSGMICPAALPNGSFYHAMVFDGGKGLDVGCDYRRADDKGGADFKLSIFATKAQSGTTLDSAFARYRSEVTQTFKDAKSVGPAIVIHDEATGSKRLPEIRSEQFTLLFNSRDYTTEVVVAVVRGWVLEIRATYTGKPQELDVDATKDAGNWTLDRTASTMALLGAADTLGK